MLSQPGFEMVEAPCVGILTDRLIQAASLNVMEGSLAYQLIDRVTERTLEESKSSRMKDQIWLLQYLTVQVNGEWGFSLLDQVKVALHIYVIFEDISTRLNEALFRHDNSPWSWMLLVSKRPLWLWITSAMEYEAFSIAGGPKKTIYERKQLHRGKLDSFSNVASWVTGRQRKCNLVRH